jgi:hypothetical protein
LLSLSLSPSLSLSTPASVPIIPSSLSSTSTPLDLERPKLPAAPVPTDTVLTFAQLESEPELEFLEPQSKSESDRRDDPSLLRDEAEAGLVISSDVANLDSELGVVPMATFSSFRFGWFISMFANVSVL